MIESSKEVLEKVLNKKEVQWSANENQPSHRSLYE
jgi:hypothetical protein